jgi:hypothetical protein
MQIPASVGRVLQMLEPNTRASIRSAERQARDEIREADSGPVRCALARVLVEDWRNGWDELAEPGDRSAALRKAIEALSMSLRRRDADHWYVDWKRGYTLRYAARAMKRPDFVEEALKAYRSAYDKLSQFCGLPPQRGEKALRSLLVDWAETRVYVGDVPGALHNFDFTTPWHRRVPDDWHEWAHAFALHQNRDYEASWRKMEPLVALLDNPHAAPAKSKMKTVIAPRPKRKIPVSYYNDMRLVLAASYARDNKREKAQAQIDKFQQLRRLNGEQPWTVAIEAERGAFIANSPGELHWLASLTMAGLPRGQDAPAESMAPRASSRRSNSGGAPKYAAKAGSGETKSAAAPTKAKATKTGQPKSQPKPKTTSKAKAKPKTKPKPKPKKAARKTPKGKSATKKTAAKRKPARKPAKKSSRKTTRRR